MRLLIVKTSSLGDIVHALPALTDAAGAHSDLRCDWLVERSFAAIPAWHPAVARVIPCELRHWRRHPLRSWRDGSWADFKRTLRSHAYDLVIDAQGLLKSAFLASRANGPLAGPDRHSAREPLAAWFYDRRYPIPAHDRAHAIERGRRLFAQALGYPLPATPPDAGLRRDRFPAPQVSDPYVLFLHGTTWAGKRWPRASWIELGRRLAAGGLRPALPWGSEAERLEAQAIARACDGLLLPRLDLPALAGWLAHARAFVGVDTGLSHLGAALGTPGVSLYGPTLPQLTGAVGAHQVQLADAGARTVDRRRALQISPSAALNALEPLLEPSR